MTLGHNSVMFDIHPVPFLVCMRNTVKLEAYFSGLS